MHGSVRVLRAETPGLCMATWSKGMRTSRPHRSPPVRGLRALVQRVLQESGCSRPDLLAHHLARRRAMRDRRGLDLSRTTQLCTWKSSPYVTPSLGGAESGASWATGSVMASVMSDPTTHPNIGASLLNLRTWREMQVARRLTVPEALGAASTS
nr:hypothetical protein CFP56_21635 [Quercus suber]